MAAKSKSSTLLFVYGTLKRGGELHPELASTKARFLGEAKIRGHLFRVRGESFPGVLPTEAREYVQGELYELQNAGSALEKIDEVEGVSEGLFDRRRTDVWLGRSKRRAWAYFYAKPEKKGMRIASGSFPVSRNAL